MKHTPGPWSLGIQPKAIVVWGDATMPRTVVARIPNVGYPERAHHDARLIAAAPDMLEALQRAVNLLRTHCAPEDLGGSRFDLTDCKDVKPILAVIAKATSWAGTVVAGAEAQQ